MIAAIGKSDLEGIDLVATGAHWNADLRLGLTLKNSKTILSERRHKGPLTIQRPFYPEKNDTCHLYILHPPGGIVGGDSLNVELECGVGTSAVVTTPGANKFYQSGGVFAKQSQNLIVRNNSCLEWLPQETILFNGCKVFSHTKVELNHNAKFFGWEVVSFGRPACNEEFTTGAFRHHFEIWQDKAPLLIDRVSIQDRAEVFNSVWGLREKPVMGLLAIVTNDLKVLELAQQEVRVMIENISNSSVSIVGKVLLCRYLHRNATTIRNTFVEIWKKIRLLTLNKSPCEPRIWAT